MLRSIEPFLDGNTDAWIATLPEYQRDPLGVLIKQGLSPDQVVDNWISASAENTFRFGTLTRAGDKSVFRDKFMLELEGFLCGDAKYEKERSGLFGEKSAARTYVISAIAVAIAPHLGVTAAFLAPIVALSLASFGKITLSAWCETRKAKREAPA
jgi:hypothetical protein